MAVLLRRRLQNRRRGQRRSWVWLALPSLGTCIVKRPQTAETRGASTALRGDRPWPHASVGSTESVDAVALPACERLARRESRRPEGTSSSRAAEPSLRGALHRRSMGALTGCAAFPS